MASLRSPHLSLNALLERLSRLVRSFDGVDGSVNGLATHVWLGELLLDSIAHGVVGGGVARNGTGGQVPRREVLGRVASGRKSKGGRELLHALAVRRDSIQHVVVERLLGLDHSARGDGVEGELHGGEAGQALSAAGARDDAEVHLGEADLGARVSDAVLAGQGELKATTQRNALDGSDRRLLHRLKRLDEIVQGRRLKFAASVELSDVRTSRKRRGMIRTRNHNRLHVRVRVGSVDFVQEVLARLIAERVDLEGEEGGGGRLVVVMMGAVAVVRKAQGGQERTRKSRSDDDLRIDFLTCRFGLVNARQINSPCFCQFLERS